MKQVWIFLKKALYLPKGIRYGIPPAAFTVVIVIFLLLQRENYNHHRLHLLW